MKKLVKLSENKVDNNKDQIFSFILEKNYKNLK